jgi:hypothetical protein
MSAFASLVLVVASIAAGGADAHSRVPRVECDQPDALRLVRYEDGSAHLKCGDREIARVGVPW